jgi:hypothetical protein
MDEEQADGQEGASQSESGESIGADEANAGIEAKLKIEYVVEEADPLSDEPRPSGIPQSLPYVGGVEYTAGLPRKEAPASPRLVRRVHTARPLTQNQWPVRRPSVKEPPSREDQYMTIGILMQVFAEAGDLSPGKNVWLEILTDVLRVTVAGQTARIMWQITEPHGHSRGGAAPLGI